MVVRLKGVYKSASFAKVGDPKRWAIKTEASILDQHHSIKKQLKHPLLSDLIEKYNEQTPPRGKTTIEQQAKWIELFGNQPLKQIDNEFGRRIIKAYAETAKSPHGEKMLRGIVKFGRTGLNVNISESQILQVAEDVKYSGFAVRYEPRKTIMKEEELTAFVAHFRKTQQKDKFDELLIFLAASGLRTGEATRVVGADVDLLRKTVTVRDRKHPTLKIGNDGIVPLVDEAWELVQAKVEAGKRGLLFPVTNPSVRFNHASTVLGLRHCRLHDLRRLFGKRCYDRGLPCEYSVTTATNGSKEAQ